jgi:hypothetical protein
VCSGLYSRTDWLIERLTSRYIEASIVLEHFWNYPNEIIIEYFRTWDLPLFIDNIVSNLDDSRCVLYVATLYKCQENVHIVSCSVTLLFVNCKSCVPRNSQNRKSENQLIFLTIRSDIGAQNCFCRRLSGFSQAIHIIHMINITMHIV